MSETELDARGMLCPIPVIRTQDTVATLQAGDVLKVYCSDPGVVHDIPAWCRINGHKVISIDEGDEEILVIVEVGAD
ncbi:MAG TPA: SirA family protein [Gammaproteobacteria bacterium]|nr:SirA family protein [Gammaproteobacteria bacterium]